MTRAHGHSGPKRADATAESIDLLAAVRQEMAVVKRRLAELASPLPLTSRPADPMPPQRLRRLKARITVVAGWGERNLATS